MSILNKKSKHVLVEAMRSCVCGILEESTTLTKEQLSDRSKFINESATYEQLLNITMNPDRDKKYLPEHVLEGAVAILHSACMTGRHNIGKNAITEGAIKLQKETGAVITESMMEAALASVERGSGLKVVGKILQEASILDIVNNQITAVGSWSKVPPAQKTQISTMLTRKLGSGDANIVINALNNGGDARKVAQYLKVRAGAAERVKNFQKAVNDTAKKLQALPKGDPGRAALKATLNSHEIALRASKEKLKNANINISTLSKKAKKAVEKGGEQVRRVALNPNYQHFADQANKGGGLGKKLMYAGLAGAAGLGAAYLWKRRKDNLQDQQQAAQQ